MEELDIIAKIAGGSASGLAIVVLWQMREQTKILRGLARDVSRLLDRYGVTDDSGDTVPPPIRLPIRRARTRTPPKGVP